MVKQVSLRIERPFNFNSHAKCWKHFNTRPAGKSVDPTACDNRHCYYDVAHKDYIYTPAWVEFLVGRLSNPGTYDQVIRNVTASRSENGKL